MQWNRKHLIYALVVGGSLAGLVADRLWLVPSEASAKSPATSSSATPAAPTRPAEPESPRPLSNPVDALRAQLAGQLDRLAADAPIEATSVRDALTPGSGWPAPPTPEPTDDNAPEAEPEPERPELRLSTVLAGGQHQAAVINGEIVRPGQSVAGYRLESIRERTVRLKRGDESIVLELESPPAGR